MNRNLQQLLKKHSIRSIENVLIKLFLKSHNISNVKNIYIKNRISNIDENLLKEVAKNFTTLNLDKLNKLFEELFDDKEKAKSGIVFTPTFIDDYIVKNTISSFNVNTKIIDPSCGCGIFLVSAAKYISQKYQKKIVDIIENNIYGMDIKEENIERVKIMLSLFAIINNEDEKIINFNIINKDSLFCNWTQEFNIDKFDYIIGNPPYINTQELNKQYIEKLKDSFETTRIGQFNIFYAFIEKSSQYLSSDNSKIGYIVPNNFLYIKSAILLRKFIKREKLLNEIIDFKDNTVFAPILTYNAIIFLNKNNDSYSCCQLKKVVDIKKKLNNISFITKNYDSLDDNGWYLVNQNINDNIKKIESFSFKLDSFIKTGIATLRDKIYILDGYDNNRKMYYKIYKGKKYYIEPEITAPYIKISKYKDDKTIGRIIFPYYEKNKQNIPYDENYLKENFPLTFEYLTTQKDALISREKGSIKIIPFFAYGRTQGLNIFGNKIIFSTFSFKANFINCPENDALISNGYCISGFEDIIDQDILLKILNSKVMNYYIDNTSYSISGNFKCYQKKYVKNFSIPDLNAKQINIIRKLSGAELNEYLFSLYNIITD